MPNTLSSHAETSHLNENNAPWLRHYDAHVPHHVEYDVVPLYHWLDKSAREHPNTLACLFENKKITYSQLQVMAEKLAANLAEQGVKPGDRVAIMLPNLPQTMIAFWGVLKAGACVVMTNPLYMEKELLHHIKDAGVTHMITADLCWSKIDELRNRLGLQKIFVTTVADALSFPLNALYKLKTLKDKNTPKIPYDGKGVLPFKTLLKGGKRLCVPVEDPKETVAVLQYSGGTTGMPKGVMLTHYTLSVNAQQGYTMLSDIFRTPARFLAAIPFFHVYGLTTCLVLPALVHCTVYPQPLFVPVNIMKLVAKHRITLLPGAPSMYIALLQHKNFSKYDLSCMQYCISGSAPMPVEYINSFHERTGGHVIEGYGLSEASPITHLNPQHGERKVGSIGMPLPDTEARIVDMELGTVPMPIGTPGELIVRGPQIMKGYWNKPDETANAIRNGWLYTGDIAVMDEEGYFTIVDRKKDMIIVGGYNVYPRDIDEVLYSHPKIKDAVAVGVTHPTRGEIIKAYVVVKPGETLTRNEIMNYCRSKLANYKIPRQVEFRDELPKSIVGKVLRRMLRAEEDEKLKQGVAPDEAAEAELSALEKELAETANEVSELAEDQSTTQGAENKE